MTADESGAWCTDLELPVDCHYEIIGWTGEIPGDPYRIDVNRHPPVTTVKLPGSEDDWYGGGGVQVEFEATDRGGSGVACTEYSTDGGETWLPVPPGGLLVTGHGIHTIHYRSCDRAGHVEQPKSVTVRIDERPPAMRAEWDPNDPDMLIIDWSDEGEDGPGSGTWRPISCPCRYRNRFRIRLRCRDSRQRAGGSHFDP